MKHNVRLVALAILGIALIAAALSIAGANPIEALQTVIERALLRPAGIREILKGATPLILLGVSVTIALRAGLFNIGADGQFVIGALCGSIAALKIPGPGGIAAAIVAGCLGGALWAYPVGWIKAARGGHEVISSIMLNSIAGFLTTYLIANWLKDPTSQQTTTAYIDQASQIPYFFNQNGLRISPTIFIALVVPVGLWWYLKRTVGGFELNATGKNANVARFAGIKTNSVILRSMVISGAVAGFAGALQVIAFEHRFYSGFSPGYGFDALGVSLLSGSNPLALLLSGSLFSIIAESTSVLSRVNIPKDLSYILLGILVIVFAAIRYRKEADQHV
jgi:simple sugar transport system permease protein